MKKVNILLTGDLKTQQSLRMKLVLVLSKITYVTNSKEAHLIFPSYKFDIREVMYKIECKFNDLNAASKSFYNTH